MAKNLYHLGVLFAVIAVVGLIGLFVYSMIYYTVEVRIALLTIVISAVTYVSKLLIDKYKQIPIDTVKGIKDDIMEIKQSLHSKLDTHERSDHDRYDNYTKLNDERYEEIHTTIERSNELMSNIEGLILTGHLTIKN